VIRVEGLSKRFGRTTVLDAVRFEVPRGQIVGFLGPNGAGKTTTLRIITGFVAADAGRVVVDGVDLAADPARARARIGYLPETNPLYGEMRVYDFLRFRARIKAIRGRDIPARIEAVLSHAGLDERRRSTISTLSKGFRQRVGIADALLAAPPLLILDEPTAGLDPVQVRELRALLAELAGRHTVLLSSHQLAEVEAVADHLVVLVGGRVVAEGAPAELRGAGSLEDRFVELASR
jgi:ABC-2 type transport system ATP-binding protein